MPPSDVPPQLARSFACYPPGTTKEVGQRRSSALILCVRLVLREKYPRIFRFVIGDRVACPGHRDGDLIMQNINAEFRGHHCEAVDVPMRLDGLGEYQSPQRDAELRKLRGARGGL
jgi:hypothetical protein